MLHYSRTTINHSQFHGYRYHRMHMHRTQSPRVCVLATKMRNQFYMAREYNKNSASYIFQ